MSEGLLPRASNEIAALANEIYWAKEFDPTDPGFGLFVGSGCSLPLAPTSSELIEKLLEEMYRKIAPRKRLQGFKKEFRGAIEGLSHFSLEVVCEAYKEKRGPDALLRSLKAKFGKLGNFHKGYEALGELVKRGYFKLVFTTNIDTLMDDTFSGMRLKFDIVDDLSDFSRRPSLSRPCIYKLHGSYNKFDPNIAWRDVQQLHPRKELHLRHFFESNTFIFVGYSLQDMDIFSALWKVDPSFRERLRIYSFTMRGESADLKKLLRRFNSFKGNIALGDVHRGGAFFFALKDEIESVEEKEKSDKTNTV